MLFISRCKRAIGILAVGFALCTPVMPARADTSFTKNCDVAQGFSFNLVNHHSFGHLTHLSIGNIHLAADIPVSTSLVPENAISTTVVVGIIEKFQWSGGVGDTLTLDLFVSADNARQLKVLQQGALKTTFVNSLDWWTADYEQEVENWFKTGYSSSIPYTTRSNSARSSLVGIKIASMPVTDEGGIPWYAVELTVTPSTGPQ